MGKNVDALREDIKASESDLSEAEESKDEAKRLFSMKERENEVLLGCTLAGGFAC